MSAFVVEDDTINRILTWLYHETQSSNGLTYGRVRAEAERALAVT